MCRVQWGAIAPDNAHEITGFKELFNSLTRLMNGANVNGFISSRLWFFQWLSGIVGGQPKKNLINCKMVKKLTNLLGVLKNNNRKR